MKVKIKKVQGSAVLPQYHSEHAAGMDFTAAIDKPVTLQPFERKAIPTGIALALPPGYEMQLRPRSGLGLKHGIALANGVGTIDADFRGEINALLINLGTEPFTVEPGMRIVQAIIAKCERAEWEIVDTLDDTQRGDRGYGHTGLS